MCILCSDCEVEISEPTVVMASASLQVSHFNYFAFAIFKILTLLDYNKYSTLWKHSLQSGEDYFWKSGVLCNKLQTLAFQSPVFSDCQVFWLLNLKFPLHKRQFPSLPTAAGFTGVRRELWICDVVEETMAFPHTAISNFTYCPTVAAVWRVNWLAKFVLHVAKMSFVARKH